MESVKIKGIKRIPYKGKVYNLEIEPNHSYKDDQFWVEAGSRVVSHNCHPRDNIALRNLAENLDLGYDFYGTIMEAREIQAKNLASKIMEQGNYRVLILGKAYKPNVPYTDGSYSVLVAHYCEEMGATVKYVDKMLGGTDPGLQATYLIGHLDPDLYNHPFAKGSTIIDPWRGCPDIEGVTIIRYGDSRN